MELADLAAGRYVLVHRVNTDRQLRESDYPNNAALLLLQLGGTAERLYQAAKDLRGERALPSPWVILFGADAWSPSGARSCIVGRSDDRRWLQSAVAGR